MKHLTRSYSSILLLVIFSIFSYKLILAQESTDKNEPGKIKVAVHVNSEGTPIHPYTYGMFTELLDNIFDHGLWAEMLSDRKFF